MTTNAITDPNMDIWAEMEEDCATILTRGGGEGGGCGSSQNTGGSSGGGGGGGGGGLGGELGGASPHENSDTERTFPRPCIRTVDGNIGLL